MIEAQPVPAPGHRWSNLTREYGQFSDEEIAVAKRFSSLWRSDPDAVPAALAELPDDELRELNRAAVTMVGNRDCAFRDRIAAEMLRRPGSCRTVPCGDHSLSIAPALLRPANLLSPC